MNLSLKNPGLLLTAILGGAALAYTFLIFVPGQQSLAQVKQEIQSRQLYVLEANQAAAELTKSKRELAETEAFLSKQREALPVSAELSQYIGELTSCATNAGVRIGRFSPQFTQNMPPLSRVGVFMSIEGELDQIFAFAARLEELKVPIWCQQFTVETELKSPGTVRAEFELLIFANNIEKSG